MPFLYLILDAGFVEANCPSHRLLSRFNSTLQKGRLPLQEIESTDLETCTFLHDVSIIFCINP